MFLEGLREGILIRITEHIGNLFDRIFSVIEVDFGLVHLDLINVDERRYANCITEVVDKIFLRHVQHSGQLVNLDSSSPVVCDELNDRLKRCHAVAIFGLVELGEVNTLNLLLAANIHQFRQQHSEITLKHDRWNFGLLAVEPALMEALGFLLQQLNGYDASHVEFI